MHVLYEIGIFIDKDLKEGQDRTNSDVITQLNRNPSPSGIPYIKGGANDRESKKLIREARPVYGSETTDGIFNHP